MMVYVFKGLECLIIILFDIICFLLMVWGMCIFVGEDGEIFWFCKKD